MTLSLRQAERRWEECQKDINALLRRQAALAKAAERARIKLRTLVQEHHQNTQALNQLKYTRQHLAATIEILEDAADWEDTA